MGKKRDKQRDEAPPELPKVGAMTRTLFSGVTVRREANAHAELHSLGEHGHLILREITWTNDEGRQCKGWEYDTTLVRPPPGAVLGDPWSQSFTWGGPKLWYEDLERTCVQCGDDFTFSAAEQKFWYETLRFNDASTAVRCVQCRKRTRTRKALENQLGLALRATEAAPQDPDRWLELARVAAQLRAMAGTGDLDRAIDAARRAWRLSEERLPEALFWESVLHHMAGREAQAIALEDTFLSRARSDRPLQALVQSIRSRRSGADR